MPAIAAAAADVIVVADADVFCDELEEAVELVTAGEAAWAVPHLTVHRLAEEATGHVLAGAEWEPQELAERPYVGLVGGGVVVARRETLLEVPLDPRFVGWGQEDESWGFALVTMLGEPWRGTAPLVHLWHPPQPRVCRRRGSAANWAVFHRYRRALWDRDAMRELISEAKRDLEPAHPGSDDRPAQSVRAA